MRGGSSPVVGCACACSVGAPDWDDVLGGTVAAGRLLVPSKYATTNNPNATPTPIPARIPTMMGDGPLRGGTLRGLYVRLAGGPVRELVCLVGARLPGGLLISLLLFGSR